MKSIAKKIIVFSMVGLMQVGLFATVAEAASPRQPERPRYEQRHDHQRQEREKEKQRKIKQENERHEKEMKRRPFESQRKWKERQRIEIERHKRAIHEIMKMGHR